MKRYKLLKDLPFAKAGEIFDDQYEDGILTFYHQNRTIDIYKKDIEYFDDWFEEKVEEFYYINEKGFVSTLPKNYIHSDVHLRRAIGNYFKTKEEAEKYLEYLKAKAIIKQDTKGFTPDWHNVYELKFYGYYDTEDDALSEAWVHTVKRSIIYFKSVEDIKESFKNHPEEWKTYLTYEQ